MAIENNISKTAYIIAKYVTLANQNYADLDQLDPSDSYKKIKTHYPEHYIPQHEIDAMKELVNHYEKKYGAPESDAFFIQNMNGEHEASVKSYFARKKVLNSLLESEVKKNVKQVLYYGGEFSGFTMFNSAKYSNINFFEGTQQEGYDFKMEAIQSSNYLQSLLQNTKSNLTFYACDLEKDDIMKQSENIGFKIDKEKKTLIIYEGVMPYLSRETNERLFKKDASFFRQNATIFFSYANPPEVGNKKQEDQYKQRTTKDANEPYKSFYTDKEMPDYLRNLGLEPKYNITKKEFYGLYNMGDKASEELGVTYMVAEYVGKKVAIENINKPCPKLGNFQQIMEAKSDPKGTAPE